MKKKAISLLLAAAMVFSMAACGAKSDSDTKETKKETTTDAKDESSDKEITAVARGTFYPIAYTDDGGNLTGFEVEALKEACDRQVFLSSGKYLMTTQLCFVESTAVCMIQSLVRFL